MATSPRMRVTWTGIALAAAFGAAAICILLALLVRSGLEFMLAILSAASILLAAFACRRAGLDSAKAQAKLSDDVTAVAQRLLRLESRAPDGPAPLAEPATPVASLAADIDAVTRIVSSLAEAVGSHDRRLAALEQTPSRRAAPLQSSPAAEARDLMGSSDRVVGGALPEDPPPNGNPSRRHAEERLHNGPASFKTPAARAPQDDDGGSFRSNSEEARSPPVPAAELSSRDDFARAATVILNRLRRDQPRTAEPSEDEAAIAALEAGDVELHLQPAVMLPQRRTAFYATFPHLRRADGTTVAASEIADLLMRCGQRPRLDALTLGQARTIARHLAGRRSASRMAVRLSRAALGEPVFAQGAARLLQDGPAERMILTVDHAEIDRLSGREIAVLEAFRTLGATLALEAVPDLDQDWNSLAKRGFGIAMLDASTILGARPHGVTLAFAAEAARSKVQLVATGVDRDGMIPDLLDFDLPLAMGPGLAPPRPVRSDVLAPTPAGEPTAGDPPAAQDARGPEPKQEGPVPFRDFLRRAG